MPFAFTYYFSRNDTFHKYNARSPTKLQINSKLITGTRFAAGEFVERAAEKVHQSLVREGRAYAEEMGISLQLQYAATR